MSSYDYLINTERAKENAKKDAELGTNAPMNTAPGAWRQGYDLENREVKGVLSEVIEQKKQADKEKKDKETREAANEASKRDDYSDR